MKKVFIFIVSMQFSIASLLFSQTWIPFNGTTQNSTVPSINLVASSNQEVTIHCKTYGMNSSQINVDGVNYNRISIPNLISSVNTGDPELPVITKLIAIPECSSLSATVLNKTETTYSNFNVYPAPEVVEEEINGQIVRNENFIINTQTYNTNSFLPQNIISIVTTGYLRGQKYAQITFYPIQFNPVTKSLKAITSCDRAQYVKNWCNLDLGNFDQAIEWFENRLISPESLEDSVFSIIDLNYVIQRSLVDIDLKSSPTCRFPEVIAKSQREFFSKRSQLIDLLYTKKEEQSNIVRERTHVEIKVYPNPVSNILNTEINSLLEGSFVGIIRLSDELGKLVTEFNGIDVTSGKNNYSFSLLDVRPGVYYLNLYKIDEIISSCKVIVLPY